ncbi:MAG: D-sedoheptulose 7-phosphate isomerase [Phycisphaerae bacterium]|nr:D-sedoheptulose 7-phosphate isomerase [Phycisphaerae bacterium]
MNKSIRKKITKTIEAHKKTVAEFQADGVEAIEAAANLITKTFKRNGRLYICGNGGSAADAQHIASEFIGRFERERKPLPAVALTTDTSILTSIANDYGYENTFVKQVEALVKKGDVLWGISTSGSSPNIIAAVKSAKKKGAKVLAFTGKKNSKLENMADVCLCANSKSTARSQEIHLLGLHIICGLVEDNFCK